MARARGRGWAVALVVAFAGLVPIGACSSDETVSPPNTIDARGGTVTSGEVTLEIPPGALSSPQTITITKIEESPPAGVRALSAVYRFEPEGLVFLKPVSARFATAGTLATASAVRWTSTTGAYESLATEVVGSTARADVMHFSRGFVGLSENDALDSGADTGGPSDAGANPCSRKIAGATVESVAGDALGNIVVAGTSHGTQIDVAGSKLPTQLTTDTFIAKLDSACNVVWARTIGAQPDGGGLYVDARVDIDASNEIFVYGQFSGSISFGGAPLASAGNGKNVFLAKLTSAGTLIWNKKFGASDVDVNARALAVDATGAALITGLVNSGNPDFGNGPIATAPAFVAKLDGTGNHVFSKAFGGDPLDVAVSGTGRIVVAVQLKSAYDFGGGALSFAGDSDAALVELDGNGNHVFSRSYGDADFQSVNRVAFDSAGNLYAAGPLRGTLDLGSGVVMSNAYLDSWLAKLNAQMVPQWGRALGAVDQPTNAEVGALAVDSAGNVFIAGNFANVVNVGNGWMYSAGSLDAFMAKLRPNGDVAYGKSFGDPAIQLATRGTVDSAGGPVLVGRLDGTMDFGSGALSGSGDGFIARFEPGGPPSSVSDAGPDSGGDSGAVTCTYTPRLGDFVVRSNDATWKSAAGLCGASPAGVLPFTTTGDRQVTMLHGHLTSPPPGEKMRVVSGCGPTFDLSTSLATADASCGVATAKVSAGTYSFFNCYGAFEYLWVVEPVPPAPTNTTCTTRTTNLVQGRVVDALPRYYEFTAGANATITVTPGTAYAGKFTMKVYAGCGGALVGSTTIDMCSSTKPTYTLSAAPAGTYVIEATQITAGADWTITVN